MSASVPYVELHAHSAFSFLDGASTPLELAAAAARLGYPASLPLHLAAGRPILLHGPAFAAASRYLKDNQAGHTAPDFHAAAIYNGLCRLVDDPSAYRRLGAGAVAAFRRDFTIESARSSALAMCNSEFVGALRNACEGELE